MRKAKILIVDDQWTNIAYLRRLLKDYDVLDVNDGRSALKLVADEKPDLILLDVMMPGIDGYSVLNVIRQASGTRLIPVIVITSLSGVDEKIKSLQKGADDLITKPINPQELHARVKSLLRIKFLQDELENAQNIVITLAAAIDAKDQQSAHHSRRTAYYASLFAQVVMLSKTEADRLKMAGFLHDIGNIGIKDNILTKPSNLEPAELEIIKTHPLIGEKICSSITSFQPLLTYIRHHHERYDGTGYPDALQGTDIPVGARILAIADAFAALTSARSYRPSFTVDEAIAILRKNEGPQWDPELVVKFCDMLDKDKSIVAVASDFASKEYYLEPIKVYTKKA